MPPRGHKNNQTIITYNIICNVESVIEDIQTLKKIVALMEILKELVSNHGILFFYNIKTSDALDEDLINNNRRVIRDFNNSEILYNRSGCFTKDTNSNNGKKK